MCGRNTLFHPQSEIEQRFDAEFSAEYHPRYNVAPEDEFGLHAITNEDTTSIDALHWGFIPNWVDDPDDGPTPINARAETAHEKPYFRHAFGDRTCLIPSSGFYEWMGDRGSKQPYFVHPEDDGLMAFAGLWDRWENGNGEPITSVTILTCDAAPFLEEIHDRMPVVLSEEREGEWLEADVDEARAILEPREEGMESYAVSKAVNNPTNDSPDLVEESDQSGLSAFS